MYHILTIDDEQSIRYLLSEVLTASGYRVTGAETAAEGLEIVRRDPPDLIITDLQLEESDGFEFIEEVKQIAPSTPVVLLTGVLFDPMTIDELGEKKIAAYLEKTAPLERILREVRRILEGK
jgi:DNA-binding NtrC family response regulator